MSTKRYSHVIVVGIDGAGSFIKDADTPKFDSIFENGALTYGALASNPTISAECWGSMLIGVGPEVHGLTNAIVSSREYPKDSPFPSLFRRISKAIPDAKLGSFCDWNPISAGIIERDLKVDTATARDSELTPMICSYIKENKPTFLFIQFDSVDGAGHSHGYGTPQHLTRIHEVDELVYDVYKSAKDAEILDDTLFIVISDHGGTNPENGGGSHGGWTDGEKYVTIALCGKTVLPCEISEANVRDLSAIVLYALGIDAPAFDEAGWTSQIPDGVFDDDNIPPYKDISHLTGAAPRVSKVPHTSELI
ncbi:MAG: nucleotide pyrophosphatase [Ruminococcaceae bacterium]|nr:nucleotide pyrophosphatase [Oscillospiraceae bacterium]